MTSAIKGKIPTPNSWKPALEKFVGITGGITLLEKQVGKTTLLDISKALDEYMRLYKAGIASKAEVLTLSRAFPGNEELSKACEGFAALPVVIGGPASVEMVDREGHLITTNALSKAFDRYMGNFRTRNTMVLHSDVQVGWALPAYISQGGQIFKSGVDGNGLFFITEIRDDTRIANKVMEQINEGKLKSYSIAGSATQVQSMMKGQVPYMQVDDLELAEVTVCEKGVNQGANFELLKGCDCPTQSCADGSCLLKEHDMIGHQTGQLSPDQVNYREASEMEKNAGIMCGSCRFFNAGMSTCDLVTGMIMAGDWCSLFDPMDKSPVLENENNVREIMLMRKSDGDIDFSSTFLNWIEKKQKSGKWAEVEKEEEAEVPKVAPSNLRPNPRDIAQYSKLPPAQQRSQVQGFKTNVQETQGGRGDPRYQAQGIPQAGKKPVGTASARMAAGGLDVTRHPPTKGKGGVPQEVGQGGSASGGPRTGFASVPGAKEKLRTQDVGSTVYHNSLKSIKKLIYSVGVGDVSDVRASDRELVDPGRQRREKNMKQEVEKSLTKGYDHSSPKKKASLRIVKKKEEDKTPQGVMEESIEKAIPESLQALRKFHGGIATLANQGGRETEHHQLLREYGFPSEQPQEGMRYVPVVETETDDWGCPINLVAPWTVNEAGQHLGETNPEDSPIHKMGVSNVLFSWLEKAGIWSPSSGGLSSRRMRTKVDPGKHAALGKPPRAKRGFRAF